MADTPKNPEDYAIVMGINHYRQFPPLLQSAEKDALRFAVWLTDPNGGGLDANNVKLLIGKSFADKNSEAFDIIEHQPNRFTLDARLHQLKVDRRERIGRRLYFYFSGHGVGEAADDVAMLLANAHENRLRDCHAGLRGYRNWLIDAAPFDELVFILDCCRNRMPENEHFEILGPTFNKVLNDPAFKAVKSMTVFATLDGDLSFEAPVMSSAVPGRASLFPDKRGLLTQAIMEGLDERKGVDATAAITSLSLAEWVRARVPALAKKEGLQQEAIIFEPPKPILLVPAPSTQPFSTTTAQPVERIPQVTITVTITPGLSGALELIRGSTFDQREAHDAAVSPWVIRGPRNDLYMIRHPASGQMLLSIRPEDIQGDKHAATI
jgi:Caspase domain